MTRTASVTSSAFAPLRHRVFAMLWASTLVSNIGTWMFNVTSGWMMTELSPSPLMVSLVQAATSLPIFLFALPAGAMGDLFDRRKILLISQFLMAVLLFVFAGLLWFDINSAWLLLVFTFIIGISSAVSNPAFQAIVPRIVPREDLPAAITLIGMSTNAARAVGPALGGFILGAVGAIATVLLDALSYLAIVAAMLWWRANAKPGDSLPRERMSGAIMAGVRFASRSVALRHTIIRAIAFFIPTSAYWALLPLVAKELLGGGPGLYGMILTALGAGAVSGTFLLPTLRHRCDANHIVAIGSAGTGLSMLFFAFGTHAFFGLTGGVIAGVSWIMVLSSLNLSAQVSLPDWVRARGLAIFRMMFFGAMAAGSVFWGQMAATSGLSFSLTAAAAIAFIGIPLSWRFRLNLDEHTDHSPANHWPEPVLLREVNHDHGPVLITIEYQIADKDRDEFIALMKEMGSHRRRDGVIQWGYFEDVAKPGRFIEMFTEESWIAHLRQHARVSASDKALQDKIRALHQGEEIISMHAVTPGETQTPSSLPKRHRD